MSPTWRKSSRSSGGTSGECVELAAVDGAVGLRDSKDPDGPRLALSPDDWRALVVRLKREDTV